MANLQTPPLGPENASTPDQAKPRSRKPGTPASRQTKPRDVLAVLALDERVRSEVMAGFKARGGSLDRWQRADAEAMADSITRAEDAIETRLGGKWTATREALRAIRRRLECEAWP